MNAEEEGAFAEADAEKPPKTGPPNTLELPPEPKTLCELLPKTDCGADADVDGFELTSLLKTDSPGVTNDVELASDAEKCAPGETGEKEVCKKLDLIH